MLSVVLAGMLAGCSKDEPFDNGTEGATGQFSTRSLGLEVSVQNGGTRAGAPNVNDFTVEFYRDGAEDPEASYTYGRMPELVTLPVGHYTAVAYYGDHTEKAKFENPCYRGETEFDIEADKITTAEKQIVCTLSNVKVTVVFDASLQNVAGEDCVVTVKVGKHDSDPDAGVLDYTALHVANESAGYFAHEENSNTLVAIFNGTVDGGLSHDLKTFSDVKPGTHYRIVFRLHNAGDEDPGFIGPDDDGMITIETVVDTEHIEGNVDPGETTLPDDMRPQEGEPEPDDPVVPDDPNAEKPSISVSSPYEMGGKVNEIELTEDHEQSKYPVILHVKSASPGGFTAFKVKIDSNTLTKRELEDVELTDEFDLVSPGQYTSKLQGLGFLEEGVESLRGATDVSLSITDFIPLLVALGEGTHNFILTVSDANGTTVDTLTFHNIAY